MFFYSIGQSLRYTQTNTNAKQNGQSFVNLGLKYVQVDRRKEKAEAWAVTEEEMMVRWEDKNEEEKYGEQEKEEKEVEERKK